MVDEKRFEGKTEDLKGKFKEGVGRTTGDREMEGEGKVEQKSGKIKDTVGKVKDTVRDLIR